MRNLAPLLLVCLAGPIAAQRVTVSILATTDLHGNIYPVDYFRAQPAPRGLAMLSTLIRQARADNPNSLLIDCGDTIQGTPLEYVYQEYLRTGKVPLGAPASAGLRGDPIILAMNQIGYDALVLGNHDFNYGLKPLGAARRDSRFPWLSANTAVEPGSSAAPFAPYLIKTVAGVRVAIVGVTTTGIPNWERPENYRGYRFHPAVEAARRTVGQLRDKADFIVVAAHAGLGREGAGASEAEENMVLGIAKSVEGIQAVIYGHSHQQEPGRRVGNVLLVQPKNWGISLARVDFTLEKTPAGFSVVDKTSRLEPVRNSTVADPEILALAKPYHEAAERYLDTPVASAPEPLDAALGRVEDNALLDAIHAVQLHYSHADVSFASIFNVRVKAPRGPVTVRQIAALYLYDNELYAIEGNGQMVKDALENAARCFMACRGGDCSQGPLLNSRVAGYNCDTAEGVEYEVDLSQPEGSRIRNLRWKGRPLEPSQKLRIAANNYRAGGSGGYTMFRGALVVWRSGEDIRQLIIDYYTARKQLPARADGNWRILPPAAAERLRGEALSIAEKQQEQ
jgi:2',3'-cyclic-nucleotide 2'-phosphodiesterase / 3'-nucleotidase